jgi:hypothetical protein
MRRTLSIFVLVALLVTAATAAASTQPRLTWRTGQNNGYRVLLPSTWRYRNASYPSDHATYLWYDPTNPLRKLLVTVSGCIGCVETNFDPHRPNPKGELPSYATGLYWISPWKLAFSGYVNDDPFPANGLVVVLDYNGRVAGSAIAELWLPTSQHSLATRMLNSFSPRA